MNEMLIVEGFFFFFFGFSSSWGAQTDPPLHAYINT